MTDEADLARVQEDLVAWGLLERVPPLALTRRLRGALTRAAIDLQALEQAGQKPHGNPVEVALDRALTAFPLPDGAEMTEKHRKFLVAVEIESLPPAVRELLGL